MGYLFEDEKPDYKRQAVKEYLKNKLVFGEYDDLEMEKVERWVEKVKKEGKGKKVMIDVRVMETGEGFCQGPDEVRLEPYFVREENDAEYRERIEDEERQYKENQEKERLKKENYEEYKKDMDVVEKIRKKWKM